MQTVIEHPTFQKQAESIWNEHERHAFIDWIAENPNAGDVIPGADGRVKSDRPFKAGVNVVVQG